ncbi:MAG: secretion protein, partial [Planctomycetes bacterium]|nr:secretion protein [Planctomycetota bacterium]
MLVSIIALCVGIGVAAVISAFAIGFKPKVDSIVEDRLASLTELSRKEATSADDNSILRNPMEAAESTIEKLLKNRIDLATMLEQADIKLPVEKFALICIGVGGLAAIGCFMVPIPKFVAPLVGIPLMFVPVLVLKFKIAKRMAKFNEQLPEALEMLSRSLRAGHSIGAGFGLISQEMSNPLGREFGRCYEEQNLGVSLESSLDAMAKRIPNLDLRFFATAVILQRQTGGDLAEILEKIGRLIRSRYKLAGQIQALTGEGRLSGIVLLALPPGLFLMMFFLN